MTGFAHLGTDEVPGCSPTAKAGAGMAAYDCDYGLWQAWYTHFPPDPSDPEYGGQVLTSAPGAPATALLTTPGSAGSLRRVDPTWIGFGSPPWETGAVEADGSA